MGLILITNLQLLLNVLLLAFAGVLILLGMYMSDEDSLASTVILFGCQAVEYFVESIKTCRKYVKRDLPQVIGTYGGYILVFYALGRFVWYLSLSLCGSIVKLICPCFFPKQVPPNLTADAKYSTKDFIARETVFECKTKTSENGSGDESNSDRRMVVSGKKRHKEKRTGDSSRNKLKEIEYYKYSSSKKSHRKPKVVGAIEYYTPSEDDKKSRKKKNGEIKTFDTSDGTSNSPETQDIDNNLNTTEKKKHRKRRDKEKSSETVKPDEIIDIESTNDELDNDQSARKKSEKKARKNKNYQEDLNGKSGESVSPDEVIDIESTNDELDNDKKEKKTRKKKSSKKSSKKIKNGTNDSNNDETHNANRVLDEMAEDRDQVTENVDNQNLV